MREGGDRYNIAMVAAEQEDLARIGADNEAGIAMPGRVAPLIRSGGAKRRLLQADTSRFLGARSEVARGHVGRPLQHGADGGRAPYHRILLDAGEVCIGEELHSADFWSRPPSSPSACTRQPGLSSVSRRSLMSPFCSAACVFRPAMPWPPSRLRAGTRGRRRCCAARHCRLHPKVRGHARAPIEGAGSQWLS